MSPRPYRLGEREASIQQTRDKIVEAARHLLMERESVARFSIEAVSRKADVARMTVYYQFGSRVGLLEAICDTMASNGGIEQLGQAFRKPDARDALSELIRIFGHFWESDRQIARVLRAMATLDEEFELVIRARDNRRRRGLRMMVERLVEQDFSPPDSREETIELLFTLTSFEAFDMLAGDSRSCVDVIPTVQRVVHAALGLPLGQ